MSPVCRKARLVHSQNAICPLPRALNPAKNRSWGARLAVAIARSAHPSPRRTKPLVVAGSWASEVFWGLLLVWVYKAKILSCSGLRVSDVGLFTRTYQTYCVARSLQISDWGF